LDLPEALHSLVCSLVCLTFHLTVTVTETQLHMTNDDFDLIISAASPWENLFKTLLPKGRTSSGTRKSYEMKKSFPSLLLDFF
jgi:hypothetical protein